MVTVAHLKCQSCNFKVTLRAHQECWVDEEGDIGVLDPYDSRILGEPKGRIQTGYYDSKFCTTCGKVYNFLRMDIRPEKVKHTQKNGLSILSDAEVSCPRCETILLEFLSVLELIKHRERAFRVAFNRVYVPEREMLQCPKCKTGKLELTSYRRSD